jgi:hypothetical protein
MWAKYSILHLLLPLAFVFLLVPNWRRQIATTGPWLAAALAALIVAPHLIALTKSGGHAVLYAVRNVEGGTAGSLKSLVTFLFNAGALFVLMGIVTAAAAGVAPLSKAVVASFRNLRENRRALYLHAALFGPIALIILSAPFGVRARAHWLTPIALSVALWWADKVAAEFRLPRRAVIYAVALSLLFAVSYAARQFAPTFVSISPSYADFDGPALERMADRYWRSQASGPIPYVVSFGNQRGRQVAGSIVFDSPHRPQVFEEANPRQSPWIDMADLARRGAIVVSTRPLTSADVVAGRPVQNIVEFERPTRRRVVKKQMIYFGVLPPAGRP